MQRPFIWINSGFVLGIASALYCELSRVSFLVSFLFFGLFALIGLLKSFRLLPLLLLILFTILGNYQSSVQIAKVRNSPLVTWANENKSYWAGEVTQACEEQNKGSTFLVDVWAIRQNEEVFPVSGVLKVHILQGNCEFEIGDKIQSYSFIKTPQSFNNSSSWDASLSLWIQSASAQSVLETSDQVFVREKTSRIGRHVLSGFRKKLRLNFQNLPQNESTAVLKALLLGEKASLSLDTQKLFQRSGTLHLLVVSGLHFAMLAGFFYFFFRGLLSFYPSLALSISTKRLALVFSLIPILIYAFILPNSPSVFRSVLAIFLSTFFLCFSRRADSLSVLNLAAWALLISNPLTLFDLSFQFSFLAVASILWALPRLQDYSKRFERRFFQGAIEFFGISFVLQIFLFPLTLYYFHQWSSVSLLANAILVPYFSFLLMPLSFLALLFTPYPQFSHFLLGLSLQLLKPALYILNELTRLDWSLIWVSGFRKVELLLYFVFLYLCFFRLKRFSFWIRGSAFLGIVLILCSFRPLLQSFNSNLNLCFYDVGQGDALLLRLPKGENILIDAGGLAYSDFDIGERVLAPALLGEGVRKIETFILTHPHPDHYAGMNALLDIFHPQEILWNGENLLDFGFQNFLGEAEKEGVRLKKVNERTPVWEKSGVRFRILSPRADTYFSQKPDSATINNHSLVLELEYKEFRLILAGDIQKETEERLFKEEKLTKVDLLKVPHHGSDTSSTIDFLQALKPRVALIGVGKKNSFHFPREEILERYQDLGTEVLRTDQDGEICIEFQKEKMKINTFSGKSIDL